MPLNLDDIDLRKPHATSLARQLYMQFQQQILHGQLAFRERLPASRQLAQQLSLSRGVIVECYDMLKSDGLIAGFGKGGSRVCYQPPGLPETASANTTPPGLSSRGRSIAGAREYAETPFQPLPLTPSAPDLSLFPQSRWLGLGGQAIRTAPSWYQRRGGLPALKSALSLFLRQYRGIRIDNPDRLIVTTGTQASLGLLARLLAQPGDKAIIEHPGWPGSKAAMIQARLHTVDAPLDESGACIDDLFTGRGSANPRLAVISPAIQFPSGRVMTMQRREQWLQLSSMNKCWLIEDDYAAEYSFEQHPAPSLLSHSTTGHVIHVGTMSKLLFPGLRLGWMVVPSHICEQVIQASNTAGLSPSYVIQQQLALFIQYGQLATHLAQTRQLYNQRRRAASGFLKQHAAELLNVTDSISGMNLYLELNPQRVALEQLPERLATAGLGGELFVQQQPQGARFFLLIGHAALAQEDLSEHLNRLIHCLRLDS